MTPMLKKRELDIVIISDTHLGTYGCHAKELLCYLKSIRPKMVILNGDIIDMWQFNKRYWPDSHMKVVKKITAFLSKGIPVYYITGNHDEMLRKFSDFKLGSFSLSDKLVLELHGKRMWIFHGDVFDVSMKYSKVLAKLGGHGYDILILINRFANYISQALGRDKLSFSKKVKDGVKSAIKYINDFEKVAADIAIDNKYDYVICGHIHKPEMKLMKNAKGEVIYLNSGDWIENLSALEYKNGVWELYEYAKDPIASSYENTVLDTVSDDLDQKEFDSITGQLIELINTK